MTSSRPIRQHLFAIVATLVASLWAMPATAADYPTRPVKLVVPYPPGGSSDAVARLVAQRLTTRLKQPVVVENRAGAGALVGSDYVVKQPADGYTLLLTSSALSVGPAVKLNMPFDPAKDLQPVAMLSELGLVLVASNELPVNSVKDLIAYLKANPGKVNYGAYGTTATPNIAMIMFNQEIGAQSTFIPYKGAAQAIPDMIAGRLHLMIDGATSSVPIAKAGKIKLLAVTSEQRSPLLPDVPAVAETLPGFNYTVWIGISGPKGMPRDVVNRLNREIDAVTAEPEVMAAMREQWQIRKSMSPDKISEMIDRDVKNWIDSAKKAGIKAEE